MTTITTLNSTLLGLEVFATMMAIVVGLVQKTCSELLSFKDNQMHDAQS
jgi:hypothetical protein